MTNSPTISSDLDRMIWMYEAFLYNAHNRRKAEIELINSDMRNISHRAVQELKRMAFSNNQHLEKMVSYYYEKAQRIIKKDNEIAPKSTNYKFQAMLPLYKFCAEALLLLPKLKQPTNEPQTAQETTPPPQPIKEESEFSGLEWATIFYYANSANLLPEKKTRSEKRECFIKAHNIELSAKYFKTKYHEAEKRLNKTLDYPIDKLMRILPFLKSNYKQSVAFLENDIEHLKTEKSDY